MGNPPVENPSLSEIAMYVEAACFASLENDLMVLRSSVLIFIFTTLSSSLPIRARVVAEKVKLSLLGLALCGSAALPRSKSRIWVASSDEARIGTEKHNSRYAFSRSKLKELKAG